MTRHHTLSSAVSGARTGFQRKLAMIGLVGTVLPLAALALLYVLAPLPMTTATADILRTANRFAAVVVLLHWSITLAVWAASKFFQPAPARQANWQGVKLVRRASN